MSPTSYQTAPPRNLIVTIEWGSVKPESAKDVEKSVSQPILVGISGRANLPLETHANCDCLIIARRMLL